MAWLRKRRVKRTGREHFYLCWREGGRETSRPLGTTDEAVARALLRQWQRERGEVEEPVGARDAAEALDLYLAELRLTMAPATVADYAQKLGALVRAWEGVPLHLWTRPMFVAYVGGQGWGDRTVQMVTGSARRWIAWASKCSVPMPDFVGDFKPRSPRYAEADTLSPSQSAAILAASAGHYLELPVHLALRAGLRRADIRGLRWDHVDMPGRMLRVPTAKTGRVVEVPIASDLWDSLARHRATIGPVCRGLPSSNSSLSKALHRLCDRAGVPRGGWHRFRHTYATRLVAALADQPTVGRLLGHAPGSPITARYFHTDTETLRAAVDRAFG